MAYFRVNKKGTAQTKIGSYTTSGSSEQTFTIDCGFRPKYIAVVFQGSSGSGTAAGNGCTRLIYNADLSTTTQHTGYKNSAGSSNATTIAIETGSYQRITSVSNTGFTVETAGAAVYNGTYYYFAIG